MFSEILGFLSSAGKDIVNSKKINLSNRRIRSISSFSSNSIFYFPVVLSDQCRMEEATMVQRALEKQYASFIVACISQIPFHRVSSSDAFAVDDYLKQFHQNLGVSPGTDLFSKAYNAASKAGFKMPLEEGSSFVPPPMIGVEDFFLKVWNESVEKDQDYVTYLVENYISINDVFNETGTDPYTKALTEKYKSINEELSDWGFIGLTPPETITEDGAFSGYEPQIPEEEIPTDPNDAGSYREDPEDAEAGQLVTEAADPTDQVKFTLESISDNKIRSCKNRSKLRSIESKLKGLKKKYTNYLIRYKKQYEDNKKNGTDKKLVIRFNKESIGNPKAFMKKYGSYMKIINRKLKLCEERRNELLSRSGKGEMVTANESITSTMEYPEYLVDEAALRAKQRNEIPDEMFGLPDQRKYPLHDKKHVRLAIQMSGHLSNKSDIKKLAGNIAKRANDLNMDITVSKKNCLYDYMPKSMQESTEEDPMYELTSMDEAALDNLTESIDAQLSASDDEVFMLMEAPDYEDYFDMYKRNQNLSDALKKRQEQDKADAQKNSTSSTRRSSSRTDYLNKNNKDATFDREVFTKMDMQKCNEMVPTFTKASIGFIVDDTDQVVTRDLLVGIKTYIHKVKTSELVNEVYNAIISKRKFLKLVKFVSGEERSLSDLLFGIKELKDDALKSKSSGTKWAAAFRNRKRMSKMSVPFLMKNYLPNGTIVMTMNEVEYIRSSYGVDVMRPDHCKMIMDANFLLGFVVLDQSNEIVHVMYDGINAGQFQQYSYAALEREQKNSERDMRELFRLMNR